MLMPIQTSTSDRLNQRIRCTILLLEAALIVLGLEVQLIVWKMTY